MSEPTANPLNSRRADLVGMLSGAGIEIGALHQPVHAPHLKVSYVDVLPVETLRLHYPELAQVNLVEVDILADGQKLETLPDGSQDFVIACHVIEHMVDPVEAMMNWCRVLKPGGRLFLAVPDMHKTFDKDRPITTLEHLRLDHEKPSRERDYEAFLEFAEEVSHKTFGSIPKEGIRAHADLMFEHNYSIHYHVWDTAAFREFLGFLPGYAKGYDLEEIAHAPTEGEEFLHVLEKRSEHPKPASG